MIFCQILLVVLSGYTYFKEALRILVNFVQFEASNTCYWTWNIELLVLQQKIVLHLYNVYTKCQVAFHKQNWKNFWIISISQWQWVWKSFSTDDSKTPEPAFFIEACSKPGKLYKRNIMSSVNVIWQTKYNFGEQLNWKKPP